MAVSIILELLLSKLKVLKEIYFNHKNNGLNPLAFLLAHKTFLTSRAFQCFTEKFLIASLLLVKSREIAQNLVTIVKNRLEERKFKEIIAHLDVSPYICNQILDDDLD